MNKIQKFRIFSFVLLGIWMILIFAFSSQNADKSSKTSGSVVTVVIEAVYPEYETLSPEKQTSIINEVTHIVRKTAHFSEYFILGALSFLAAVTFNRFNIFLRYAAAFVFCVLYSVTDEIHQYFVPGRACRVFDIFIDSMGALVAIILFVIVVGKSSKIRSKLREINA